MSSRESRAIVRSSARKRSQSKERDPPLMSTDSPLRILLLGKSVSENSRVGNLILGRSAFDSEAPPDVVERVGGRLKHRHVTLINSPQLLHTHISDDQITQTVRECVSLSDPGPHVVLLLLQHQQCSAEDQERVEKLQDSFSERLLQHTLVLSTQEPTEPNQILQKIIQKCSNRHFSLQTSSSADHLLQAFEDIERSNEGRHLISGDSQCSTVEKRDTQTHSEKLNVLVCGSDGSLKSSISELILQHTHRRSESVRTDVINVLELPALFNTELSEEEVMRQTLRCVSRCHPGVHAFLLIIPDAPLNNEDRAEMEEIQKIFSSRINKHIMILIMQNSEHQTAELNEETEAVIQRFGGRHHHFSPETQVSTLMENIEQMLEENRGGVYSTETFLEAQMEKLVKYEEMKIKKSNLLETPLLTQGSRVNTEDEVRIVLLGKTGVGKSTTGNTILGRKAFTAETSHQSVTKESQRESCEINGRQVTVVDTPGLFDTELTEEEIQREIRHCISMILPGPHVFIIVLSLGQRFTKEEETSVKIIQETFGENSLMFTIVLFTRGDSLMNKSIEEFLGKPGSPLMNLIEACGHRYHVFNNNQPEERTQVSDLLEKIDNMVKANGGSFYSCKMFREMEREKQEQQMKILMDRVRETEEEKERMKMMMEEERQKQEKERKRREEELKREIREGEKHQREMKEEMKRERETFRHEIEEIRREKEKLQIKHETETDRLMKRIEDERQNHETERKRREEEFNEREERYEREINKRKQSEEKMLEQMSREREEWEKQTRRRDEDDEKRREKEQKEWSEFNEKLKAEKDRMEREKEDLQSKHEEEEKKKKIQIEELNREREELMKKHEEEKERMKMMMEEERQNQEKKKKMREEELKREIREGEEHQREMKEEMKKERETFRHEIEEIRREKEKMQIKHETETDRLMKRIEDEKKKREEENTEREEKFTRQIREKEEKEREMKEEMKREREEWEKLKEEKKKRRDEEDEKRREKEQRDWDVFNEKLKKEKDRMEREKEDLQSKHEKEEKKMKIQIEELNREREELMKTHDEEKERMKMMMKEERQNQEEEKKRREELMKQYEEEKERMKMMMEEERHVQEREKKRREEELMKSHNKEKERIKMLMEEEKKNREELIKSHEEDKERMKMMIEEEQQKQETERKKREELKREIREGEEHQREMKEEMKRERETFRHEIEEIRREKEKMQIKHETETDRLMKRIEDERQNHETERKRREEEFNEREEQYKREINKKEEKMLEQMKREREEKKRREEDEKIEKEQREFNEKLKKEKDRMEREKDLKHEEDEKKMKIHIEQMNREKEELMKRHEEEIERMKMMMEERQERKRERRGERKETEMQFNLIKEENLLKEEKRRQQEKWEEPNVQSLTSCTRLQDNGNINIVLLGKTGVGKSSSGNTILGENRFRSGRSLSAVTDTSSIEKSVINGRSVSVIDTPAFFCTNLPKEQLSKELARSVYLSASGVHAFLFVVPYGRFTEQEEDILKQMQKAFGKDVLKHVILLFTYGDEFDRKNFQSVIDGNEVVRRVIQRCRDYHVFNNRDLNDRQQVMDLLLKIDSMVEFNQGYYTNEMYERAHTNTFERFWKIQKDMFFAFNNYSAELFHGAIKRREELYYFTENE
ncbi:uncharacterized protein [Danio rerio]|uniref:GTPase IMAP family member 8 n=1 Tax=Danio rerio TaxID=7955 RepID=A0A8M6YZ46_DANRE|nr:interaptin-like [Danio rerio]|eukprot:XP_017210090.2 interaptin-like [Danio rerio]